MKAEQRRKEEFSGRRPRATNPVGPVAIHDPAGELAECAYPLCRRPFVRRRKDHKYCQDRCRNDNKVLQQTGRPPVNALRVCAFEDCENVFRPTGPNHLLCTVGTCQGKRLVRRLKRRGRGFAKDTAIAQGQQQSRDFNREAQLRALIREQEAETDYVDNRRTVSLDATFSEGEGSLHDLLASDSWEDE